MKNETTDIYEMLDTLGLPIAARHFTELSESPEFGSYTADCHPKRPPVPYYPASVSHIIRSTINHYSTVLLT